MIKRVPHMTAQLDFTELLNIGAPIPHLFSLYFEKLLMVAGSLIFVDVIKQKPFTLAVQALQLATLAVSQVAVMALRARFTIRSPPSLMMASTTIDCPENGCPSEPISSILVVRACVHGGSKCCRDPAPNTFHPPASLSPSAVTSTRGTK